MSCMSAIVISEKFPTGPFGPFNMKRFGKRGIEIDTDLDYAAQLVLNRGSAAEVRSDPFPLPLAQRLFVELADSHGFRS